MEPIHVATVTALPVSAFYWHEFGVTGALLGGVLAFGLLMLGTRFKGGHSH